MATPERNDQSGGRGCEPSLLIVRTLNLLWCCFRRRIPMALVHKPPLRHSRRRRQMPRPTAKPHTEHGPISNIDKSANRAAPEPRAQLQSRAATAGWRHAFRPHGWRAGAPAPQPANSPPACDGENDQHQQSLERDAGEVTAILCVGPPLRDQFANAARGVRHVLRHIRPGFVGVEAGDRLKQCGGEILPSDVLDFVEEIVDAQIG